MSLTYSMESSDSYVSRLKYSCMKALVALKSMEKSEKTSVLYLKVMEVLIRLMNIPRNCEDDYLDKILNSDERILTKVDLIL